MTIEERVAVIETKMEEVSTQLDRFRDHISELLTFKNSWEGGLKTMMWMLGFIGFSNLVALAFVLYKSVYGR